MNLSAKWDDIYKQKMTKPTASTVLKQNQHLLPKQGVALDLACGQGGNALLLAQAGLTTSAWDISSVAIKQLTDYAKAQSLTIDVQQRDVIQFPPEPNSLDVLMVSFFLDRALCPTLLAALKPSGLLFYQTYCQKKVSEQGPRNIEFLLAENELLSLFSPIKIRVYREESVLGKTEQGWRNQALLVAEK